MGTGFRIKLRDEDKGAARKVGTGFRIKLRDEDKGAARKVGTGFRIKLRDDEKQARLCQRAGEIDPAGNVSAGQFEDINGGRVEQPSIPCRRLDGWPLR
ncbi:hypothetical protein [Jannaschia sp. CCS1]|uniref:hypothetical protein n=1 Tax=Jannaschia sp. (strain CCS1) TaxID=290400 RepID=UPI001A937B28|nr:hypothetical protein [Jannaschia sp. CCS1]